MLERPEITILVYPLKCTSLDPFVQGLCMTTDPIFFFFDGGYKSVDMSITLSLPSLAIASWSALAPPRADRVLADIRRLVFL